MNARTGTLDPVAASSSEQRLGVEPLWRFADVQPLCAHELDATPVPAAGPNELEQSLVRLAFGRLCDTRGQRQVSARLLRIWGTD